MKSFIAKEIGNILTEKGFKFEYKNSEHSFHYYLEGEDIIVYRGEGYRTGTWFVENTITGKIHYKLIECEEDLETLLKTDRTIFSYLRKNKIKLALEE